MEVSEEQIGLDGNTWATSLVTGLLRWMHSLSPLCDLNSPAVRTPFQVLNIMTIFSCFTTSPLPRVLQFGLFRAVAFKTQFLMKEVRLEKCIEFI